jgi:predicted nucleic acid-binding protein
MACVTDTNIWIDLHVGRLSAVAAALPFHWIAADLTLSELRFGSTGESVRSLGVQSRTLSADQLADIVRLGGIHPGVSVADLAALVLARSLDATLLTGDRLLRVAAEREGVTVHGTLWLLDELLRQSIATGPDLAEALDRMVAAHRRLPGDEVRKRLRAWRGDH